MSLPNEIDQLPKGCRPIPGFDGYFASCDGHVWSVVKSNQEGTKPRKLKGLLDSKGYLRVNVRRGSLGNKAVLVHRLVLFAFVGPCPDGFQACHNDGSRTNNAPSNLRWDSGKNNYADRIRHGTAAKGSTCNNAKLRESDVAAIRSMASKGVGTTKIMGMYGMSRSSTRRIIRGLSWKHVPALEAAIEKMEKP